MECSRCGCVCMAWWRVTVVGGSNRAVRRVVMAVCMCWAASSGNNVQRVSPQSRSMFLFAALTRA